MEFELSILILLFLVIPLPLSFLLYRTRPQWTKRRLVLTAASPLPAYLLLGALGIGAFAIVDWARGWEYASHGENGLLYLGAVFMIPAALAGYALGFIGAYAGYYIALSFDPKHPRP